MRPSGMAGTRAKAREGRGPNAVFYKKSHHDALGKASKDCFAELISSRLMGLLGVDCVPTQLINATLQPEQPSQWIIRSKSYRRPDERGIPLKDFFEICGEMGESPLDFCLRMGWQKQVYDTFVVDYVTATRSRDASCFEVLCDSQGAFRLSPCMPRGFSLVNAFPGQTWRLFATADVNTTNYLGETSLERNIALIPAEYPLPPFDRHARKTLMLGLAEIEPEPGFLDACWHIIQGRWSHLESLRHL